MGVSGKFFLLQYVVCCICDYGAFKARNGAIIVNASHNIMALATCRLEHYNIIIASWMTHKIQVGNKEYLHTCSGL
jgi:hypothetical protein